jgi:hypothetical protein
MTALPVGKTNISYSGAAVTYTITNPSTITVKLWGGAGGGTFTSSATGGGLEAARGGGGGFTQFDITVAAGDTVKIEVGQGGGTTAAGNGGLGGWPDGGTGGNNLSYYAVGAGGGGSTRFYKNNVLMAVAGSGGGGASTGGNPANGGVSGGTGGGTTGGSETITGVTSATIGGGTQSAGGVNSTVSSENGASLLGGNGFATGFSRARTDSAANPAGGGGGGGYYGGAGGGNGALNSSSIACPGAGGSSWISTDAAISNTTNTAASSHNAANSGDTDYAAGIAVGGTSVTATTGGGAGGNGRAVLNLVEITAIPGNASGALVTDTVTSPAAAGSGAAAASGAIATETVTSPAVAASGGVSISPAFPAAVDVVGISGGSAQAAALVNIGINDDTELPITAPNASATGGFGEFDVNLPGPITVSPISGVATVPINTGGALNTVVLSPMQGEAFPAIFVPTDDFEHAIGITAPTATGAGAAVAQPPLIGEGADRYLIEVDVRDFRAPAAFVTALGNAAGALGTVTLTGVSAIAQQGVGASGSLPGPTVSTPLATGHGSGLATTVSVGGGNPVIRQVNTTAPQATVASSVNVTPVVPVVTVTAPVPKLFLAQTVLANFGRRMDVVAPQGRIVFSGEVFVGGSFPQGVAVSPPTGLMVVDGSNVEALTELFTSVHTLAPDVMAEGDDAYPTFYLGSVGKTFTYELEPGQTLQFEHIRPYTSYIVRSDRHVYMNRKARSVGDDYPLVWGDYCRIMLIDGEHVALKLQDGELAGTVWITQTTDGRNFAA